jgi:methyl-accepting chemotaxis protein
VAAALFVAGVALAWSGGPSGVVGAVAAAAAGLLALRAAPARGAAAATSAHEVEAGLRRGTAVMVAQVVPVWGRQIENTRDAAADGLAKILEAFAEMSGALETLTQNLSAGAVTAEPGAIDGAVRRESPALDALSAASLRAYAERDAAVAELARCGDGLAELQQLAKQGRELARHTRLVAFNASIEANRGSKQHGKGGDSGSQAVANETRMLAARMGEVGEQIERVVSRLDRTLSPERLRGEITDTTPEELALELDVRAREALNALLGSLGGALRSSGEVKAAAQALHAQIDETFVQFQFGDRISQMLEIVGHDIQNFARWVSANPYASQSDAAEWLAKLERSYTMDEQRSQHHGNVHIDRGSEVEFF